MARKKEPSAPKEPLSAEQLEQQYEAFMQSVTAYEEAETAALKRKNKKKAIELYDDLAPQLDAFSEAQKKRLQRALRALQEEEA